MSRIFLADDHALVRVGLRKILEAERGWRVVGEAADGRDAVRRIVELRPDLAILDVSLPLLNGLEATLQVTRRAPGVRVLIVSMHLSEAYVTRALEAGAKGYLLKDSADTDVVRGVQAVVAGRTFFSPAVATVLREQTAAGGTSQGPSGRYASLTAREREVFQLIAEGHSNREIANLLGVGLTTVETHRSHILEKLDVHSTRDLILYAVRCGIIA